MRESHSPRRPRAAPVAESRCGMSPRSAPSFAFTALGGRPAWANRQTYPLTLGLALGDPAPGGIVLWTRLTPEPLAEDGRGEMPDKTLPLLREIATDEGFAHMVARGAEPAKPKLGPLLKAEVDGLQPGAEYLYRIKAGSEISPVGQMKTMPLRGFRLDRFSVAFTSCQNFMAGHYTALGHTAKEDLDLVVQLGDYLYEQGSDVVDIRNHTVENPHIKLINRNREYVRQTVTAKEWTTEFRIVDFVSPSRGRRCDPGGVRH